MSIGQRRLARELGVYQPRIPLAVRELEALGLLERVIGRGAHPQRLSYRLCSETETVSVSVLAAGEARKPTR